jgi:hypothetical protein
MGGRGGEAPAEPCFRSRLSRSFALPDTVTPYVKQT